MICGDFEILTMLLDQNLGFTKYLCFLYLWNSQVKSVHLAQFEWPFREALTHIFIEKRRKKLIYFNRKKVLHLIFRGITGNQIFIKHLN